MSKRLDKFKETFEKYRGKFELHNYRLYFEETELDNSVATIHTDSETFKATIQVDNHKSFGEDLKSSAKHEAIHLLVARLSELAEHRFVTREEIISAEEELVRKLAWLIPDIK